MPPSESDVEAGDSRPATPIGSAAGWRGTFASLEQRNFRWFFASLLGNFSSMNMQIFVRGWLVFELTGSFASLGTMSLANGIAGLLTSPIGGIVADRVRQKKFVVQVGQALNATNALGVGLLIRYGALEFYHLVIAAAVHGAVQNAIMPSRQAMTPEVVGMDRLMNALALNTSGMNAARLLMPGLAGFMVGALGAGQGDLEPAQYVYFAMAALYLWSIAALLPVRIADRAVPADRRKPLEDLVDGVRYIAATPTIRLLLSVHFFMVLFSMTYFMLLPGFAKEVLATGPERLGLMTSLSGIGSLAGSLAIASMPSRSRGLVLLASALLVGVSLLAFAASTSYWLSVGILIVVGVGQAGRMSLSNVLVQSYVDDAYRGRVMSVYTMEFSLMSLGIFAIGLLAQEVGPQVAVAGSAAGLILLSVGLYVFSPAYRQLE